MAQVAGIKRKSKVVIYQGEGAEEQKIVLGALTLTSLTTLVNKHVDNLDAIWALWEKTAQGKVEFGETEFMRLVQSILTGFPHLAGDILATALLPATYTQEEFEAEAEGVMNIDFVTQSLWLYEVYLLSFTEVGGIKKVVGLIAGALGKTLPKPPV